MVSYNHQKEPRKPLGNRRIRLWRVETSLELREEANMKRTKKLLAMALAVMMAFSCMAMPAMALEDSAARFSTICSNCKNYANFTDEAFHTWDTRTVGGCAVTNFTHQHKYSYWIRWNQCSNCNYQMNKYEDLEYEQCLYKG